MTIGALLVNGEGDGVATMKDHVAGQDGDAAVLFNRGARIAQRE